VYLVEALGYTVEGHGCCGVTGALDRGTGLHGGRSRVLWGHWCTWWRHWATRWKVTGAVGSLVFLIEIIPPALLLPCGRLRLQQKRVQWISSGGKGDCLYVQNI